MGNLTAIALLPLLTGSLFSGCGFWGSGHHASVSGLMTLTGASPFRGCWAGADMGSREKNAGEEPYIAAGPAGRLVAVWDQDLGMGITAAISTDEGTTWSRHPLPFTDCRGSEDQTGTDDQWVAIGPDSRIYVSGLAYGDSSVAATSSTGAGRRWSNPHPVGLGSFPYIDKPTIAVDSRRPGRAYVVFSSFGSRSHPRYVTYFSRTTNGGNSWSRPTTVLSRKISGIEQGGIAQIAADPHPDRLYVSVFLPRRDVSGGSSRTGFTLLTSSANGGKSWSEPHLIFKNYTYGIQDPFVVGNDTRITVDPRNGTLYAVWMDARFRGFAFDDVVLSRSTDRGQHWSRPTRVTAGPGGAFAPSIDINADGVVGIGYYAVRENPQYSANLPLDYWFVTSVDGGRHFSRPLHLAGPFNFTDAPSVSGRGYFLGDYEGLAASGKGFHPVFVVLRKGKASPDVVTTTIQP